MQVPECGSPAEERILTDAQAYVAQQLLNASPFAVADAANTHGASRWQLMRQTFLEWPLSRASDLGAGVIHALRASCEEKCMWFGGVVGQPAYVCTANIAAAGSQYAPCGRRAIMSPLMNLTSDRWRCCAHAALPEPTQQSEDETFAHRVILVWPLVASQHHKQKFLTPLRCVAQEILLHPPHKHWLWPSTSEHTSPPALGSGAGSAEATMLRGSRRSEVTRWMFNAQASDRAWLAAQKYDPERVCPPELIDEMQLWQQCLVDLGGFVKEA